MNYIRTFAHDFILKLNIMKIVEVPKNELKTARLFVPVTPTEHKAIRLYCKNQKVKLTDLVRFALKQTFDF